MSEERQRSYINELKRCVKEDCDFYLEHNETYEFNNYINQLQQENEQLQNNWNELINWLENKNKIILQQHNIVEPVIKIQEVIDKIKEMINN